MAITPQGSPKWLRLKEVRVDLKRLFLKLGVARALCYAARGWPAY